MFGKLTLKYINDIDFLKNHIDNFKSDYTNLLFYLSSLNKEETKKVNEEDIIYNINLYSYYKDVKGQANLYLLNGNQVQKHGFVNSYNFSSVISCELNKDYYYLFKTESNSVTILKNHKSLIEFDINQDINMFSLMYLFNLVGFDIDSMDNIVDCLNYGMENNKKDFETFLQKCVDFE